MSNDDQTFWVFMLVCTGGFLFLLVCILCIGLDSYWEHMDRQAAIKAGIGPMVIKVDK